MNQSDSMKIEECLIAYGWKNDKIIFIFVSMRDFRWNCISNWKNKINIKHCDVIIQVDIQSDALKGGVTINQQLQIHSVYIIYCLGFDVVVVVVQMDYLWPDLHKRSQRRSNAPMGNSQYDGCYHLSYQYWHSCQRWQTILIFLCEPKDYIFHFVCVRFKNKMNSFVCVWSNGIEN